MSKPRPELARFKRLHPDRQKTLFKWLTGDSNHKPLSYAAAVKRVKKEWQIKVSVGELVRFYSWFPLSEQLHEAKTFHDNIAEFIASNPDLNLESEKVAQAGQIVFERDAIARRDGKLFIGLRRLRQEEVKLKNEREKFEVLTCEMFIEWFADETARRIVTDPKTTKNEKIAALRKHAFADVDAAEKSGAVQLPTRANGDTQALPTIRQTSTQSRKAKPKVRIGKK